MLIGGTGRECLHGEEQAVWIGLLGKGLLASWWSRGEACLIHSKTRALKKARMGRQAVSHVLACKACFQRQH